MGNFILETIEKEHNRMALNVAALAGDILLASGAEIFRVEETIDRIAHAYGIINLETQNKAYHRI